MGSDTDISKGCPVSVNTIGEYLKRGPATSVGIATDYGLDGPESNPGGDDNFRNRPDRPSGPPSVMYNGYWVFPGG